MVRKAGLAAVVFAAGAVVAAMSTGSSAVGDDNFANIDTIMGKTFGGKGILSKKANKIEPAVKAEKWDEVQKHTGDILKYANDLGKNKPPKGSPESWKKLSEQYATQAKAVDDAAKKKDAAALKTALDAFTDKKTCGDCHSAHQDN
jgi:flagellin-like hook-associated protein FlgL